MIIKTKRLILRPWESAQVLTALLGTALIAQGILNLVVALITVKIVKNQYPDVIDNREDRNIR